LHVHVWDGPNPDSFSTSASAAEPLLDSLAAVSDLLDLAASSATLAANAEGMSVAAPQARPEWNPGPQRTDRVGGPHDGRSGASGR
jgi:hypothetical protein